jgi:hypothetical protein
MLLYESCWSKYPSATLHLETKNESFKRLASLYKKMGVSNHAFPLALIQPELARVNPHDIASLNIETMSKIVYECKHNFWYYLREVVRVPPLAGVETDPFNANRANIALYWMFFNHITSILIQPRQTGKSFGTDVLMIYLLNIGVTNTLINMLTRSDDLRTQNLIRLKKIQEELPFYLNFKERGDVFNTEEIKLTSLGNMYKGNLSNLSPKLANNVGRGFTSPILHIDEACFVPNIEVALTAALMAGNAARDAARKNEMPYGTILTTTTGKIDDRDARYIFRIWNNATIWDEKFLDARDEAELINLILNNSRAGPNESRRAIVNLTFSYRQLGYSDEWMRNKLQETIAEGEDADRDLFNRWTSGTQTSPIPKEYIEVMKNNMAESYRSEIYKPYNYILKWYIDEEEVEYRKNNQVSFIVGVDTSDAVGSDDIAFVVRDHTTGEVICTATFNELNLITLADFFVDYMMKYLNAVMVIERRSSAIVIVDYMIQKFIALGVNPMKRLFNMVVQLGDEKKREYAELQQVKYYNQDYFIQQKKYIGFTTSGAGVTSRSELYSSTLISMCKYTGNCMYDKQMLTQVLSLVIRNNRVDHPEGGNDDMVIAGLLSYWLLIVGKNLDYYGIDRSTLFSRNRSYLEEKYKGSSLEEEDILQKEEAIKTLLESYTQESNPFILKQLEYKLYALSNEINSSHSKVISVEQMLEDIKRAKKTRHLR